MLLGLLRFLGEVVFAYELLFWGILLVLVLSILALLKFILTPAPRK